MKNKIWIELERPEHIEGAARIVFGRIQCELANEMLRKLAKPVHLATMPVFSYEGTGNRYHFGTEMGTEELSDNGRWFSLDYFGRKAGE